MLHQVGGFGFGGLMAVIVAASAGWFGGDPAPSPAQPVQVVAAASSCAPAEAATPTPARVDPAHIGPAHTGPATARRHRGTEQDRIAADTVMSPVRYAVFRPDVAGLVPLSGRPRAGERIGIRAGTPPSSRANSRT